MTANDDPLGVRSASVSGSDAEGRPFEVRWSARPTFFIWPHLIVGTISRNCREVYPVSVDKWPGVACGSQKARTTTGFRSSIQGHCDQGAPAMVNAIGRQPCEL